MGEAVQWALRTCDMDEIKNLLKTREDVNTPLPNGRKPIHVASDFGHYDLIEFLVSLGAEVNVPDKYGITPLHNAALEGHVRCVQFLLEKGANKNEKLPDGSALIDAIEDSNIKKLLE